MLQRNICNLNNTFNATVFFFYIIWFMFATNYTAWLQSTDDNTAYYWYVWNWKQIWRMFIVYIASELSVWKKIEFRWHLFNFWGYFLWAY